MLPQETVFRPIAGEADEPRGLTIEYEPSFVKSISGEYET